MKLVSVCTKRLGPPYISLRLSLPLFAGVDMYEVQNRRMFYRDDSLIIISVITFILIQHQPLQ